MLTRKFGRKKAHRSHMLRNLAASVILYEKVETTGAKAKEVKKLIDTTITTSKKNTLAARRELEGLFFDSNVVNKLFDVLNARYTNRNSGYTSVVRIGSRVGDNADKYLITLMDRETVPSQTKKVAADTTEKKEQDANEQ